MIAGGQECGAGDGWAATRKANRRPLYAEIHTLGRSAPEYLLVGYTFVEDDLSLDEINRIAVQSL